MKDLIILAADKDLECSLRGLLARPKALGIRSVETDIFTEPEHDPACVLRGVGYLQIFERRYKHALLMFDHEGCGKETASVQTIQGELNNKLAATPWGSRAQTIVLEPELEAWIWSDSLRVDEIAGWKGHDPALRTWLIAQGWLEEGRTKPARPKEAFEAALREVGKPRSASLYKKLAGAVGVRRCKDESFCRFKAVLQEWFSVVQG